MRQVIQPRPIYGFIRKETFDHALLPPRHPLLRTCSRHPLPRRPLRRRFQHLHRERLGGCARSRHLAERGQLGARRGERGCGGFLFLPPPALPPPPKVRSKSLDPPPPQPPPPRRGDGCPP